MQEESKNGLGKPNENNSNQLQPNNGLSSFIRNNIAATILTILLAVVFIWFTIKLRNSEKKFEEEKTLILNKSQSTIDSLKTKHLEFATEVFSWSVRSELIRNNTENLNQLLIVFVKESGADLVQLVNSEDNMVLLSSDKKFEGAKYSGNLNSNMNATVVSKEGGVTKIITPVMGLNKMIGILIVEVRDK